MNLFVTESVPDDREFELTGQEAVHAVRVLRLSPGDPVYATNGEGVIYQGVVSYAGSDRLRAEVVERRVQPVPSPDVILAIGEIKKRDRMEFAVEKAVELGVRHLVIWQGDHSLPRKLRVDRLKATALSAMKQSLRAWLPRIETGESLHSLFEMYPDVKAVVADETETWTGPPQISDPEEDRLMFIVGPEGGFSPEERKLLANRNVETLSLGSGRLRSETAAMVIASLFLK